MRMVQRRRLDPHLSRCLFHRSRRIVRTIPSRIVRTVHGDARMRIDSCALRDGKVERVVIPKRLCGLFENLTDSWDDLHGVRSVSRTRKRMAPDLGCLGPVLPSFTGLPSLAMLPSVAILGGGCLDRGLFGRHLVDP